MPENEPADDAVIPWSTVGATAEVTGQARDADGQLLDAEGNRIEGNEPA
jgi:hypothetical protein